MKTSLIATVKNEEETIIEFLDSIARQTRKPDEIVIVDGKSSDGTVEKIRSFRKLNIRLIQEECNIAKGRNIAINNARHEIIVVTDAGCILESDWFEKISDFDSETDVVVGNYRPVIESVFDACQYSIMGLFKGKRRRERILISSRSVAFRKRVWEELGGYPEWLNYSEDRYFHEAMINKGYRIKFREDAMVEWKQRKTLRQIFKQFFLYMEGDGMAKMHSLRHGIRFLTYSTGIYLFFMGFYNALYLVLLLLGLGIYLKEPYRNFKKIGRYSLIGTPMFIIPILLIMVDLAKIFGYISGVIKGKDYFIRERQRK